jgi:DNA uptake protein ComE-like DNA-binding protein
MADTVSVSVLHAVSYKTSKDAKPVRYATGIQEMPLAHAKALGLTHRIVETVTPEDASEVAAQPVQPFDGAFDEKLTAILSDAGFVDLVHLASASEDQLRSVKGIGPRYFEQIQTTLGRRVVDGIQEESEA